MRYPGLILIFVAVKFLLQFYGINPVYELHRDEYLHLDLGHHLSFGYTTVPPITGLISFVIISLGKTVFWIKFFPALFGALTLVATGKLIEMLGGKRNAMIMGMVGVTCSVLLRINTLYQPNSLEYLLWTLLFLTIIGYVKTKKAKWFWYAALVFALGFLNKYNIVFLLLGLIPALLLTTHRSIFGQRQFYYAASFCFLLILPNLIWQYRNGFPVIEHMLTLSETQLVNMSRWGFVGDQLLFFMGSVPVIIGAFIGFARHEEFKKYRLLFWSFLFVLILYLYFRAKSYYAIGLYPVMIAFGAVYLERTLNKGWRKHLRLFLIVLPILLLLPLFRVIMPVMPPQKIISRPELFQKLGMLRWEDGKDHPLPQDFADMQGWKELGALVDSAFTRIEEKDQTLIHCDNYGQAGAINFYSRLSPSEALTLHADYVRWYPLDDLEIKHVILVQNADDDDPERTREKPLFTSVSLIGEIENEFARERGTKVYLLKGATRSINDMLRAEISEKNP